MLERLMVPGIQKNLEIGTFYVREAHGSGHTEESIDRNLLC